MLAFDQLIRELERTGHRRLVVLSGEAQWTLTQALALRAALPGDWVWLEEHPSKAISGLLGWWLWRTPRGDWRQALPYALVIGGALGNVIDRLIHGHVIDFIQWHWRGHYWPAFNIADAAIVGGAIGIAVFGLLDGKRKGRE